MTVAAIHKAIVITAKIILRYNTFLDGVDIDLFPNKRKNNWRYSHNNKETTNKDEAVIINKI
jgi:hypothetical protein